MAKNIFNQALLLSPSLIHAIVLVQCVHAICLNYTVWGTAWQPINPLVKYLINKFREGSLTILNFTSSLFLQKESGCLTSQEEAIGSVLRPESLPSPRGGRCQVTPHRGGARHNACASCHQVTLAQHVAQCRVTTGRYAIKGTKIPQGNQHGT